MSRFDLREWLSAADAAGELRHINGADAVLEIGAASQLNYRQPHPRALLFDEITGYRQGRRVLTSSLSGPALMGLSLGLGLGLGDRELVGALRGRPAAWAAGAASYPVERVEAARFSTTSWSRTTSTSSPFPALSGMREMGGATSGPAARS
jgi:3-polyprenyl-4-hydroxybenzoate decarboxylase